MKHSLFLAFIFLPTIVWAASEHFVWIPNTETDLTGYKIYWGTEIGKYPNSVDTKTNDKGRPSACKIYDPFKAECTEYEINKFKLGVKYYVVATAYGGDGVESDFSDVVTVFLNCEQGHNDFCRDCGPCEYGEGDCDNDNECKGVMVCPDAAGVDYCKYPAGYCLEFKSGPDWCKACGPCPEGQGDCDGDAECQSGLICAQDVGEKYGWPKDRDVCEKPIQKPERLSNPKGFKVK